MQAYDSLNASEKRALEARKAGLAAHRSEQPANTARSYKAKIDQWKEWCRTPRPSPDGGPETAWPDGELVTPDKLAAWLREDIMERRVKPQGGTSAAAKAQAVAVWREAQDLANELTKAGKADDPVLPEEAVYLLQDYKNKAIDIDAVVETASPANSEGTLYSLSTIEAYVAAVMQLWHQQVAHGHPNTVNPRGTAVKGFLNQRRLQRARLDRENYVDRGIDGINSGYNQDQWLQIHSWLLTNVDTYHQNLRTRVDLLFGHYYLLRGENRRNLDISHLAVIQYPSDEGPTPCDCLVLTIREGKLNKVGNIEHMGSFRHKNPLLCSQGSLAQYFFYRWHIAGEAPPTFRRRRDWYNIKALVGADRQEPLAYRTQLAETWRVYGAVGLTSKAKTHLPRAAGARDARIHGVAIDQISSAGHWNHSALHQSYLTHLPRDFLKIVAGFSASKGDYYLVRANIRPPASLQAQIWPWIEDWAPRFYRRSKRLTWAQGGLDEDDMAGNSFITLMTHLRTVLLQDLAVLEPQFPGLPFFQTRPFYGPEWNRYASEVRANVEEATEPASQLVQRALPEMCRIINSWQGRLLNGQQQLLSQVKGHEKRFDSIESSNTRFYRLVVKNLANLAKEAALLDPEMGAISDDEMPAAPAREITAATAATAATISTGQGQPISRTTGTSRDYTVTALPEVYNVHDVWRHYKVKLPGAPAGIEALETQYGSRWRPGNTLAVAIHRRKAVCDEVSRLIRNGQSEEMAIEAVERLRGNRSITTLAKALASSRKRKRND
jgi:hypothetical protein